MNENINNVENNNTKEKDMNKVAYIISGSGDVNMIVDGKNYMVPTDHVNYDKVVKALKEERYEGIVDLVDVSASIAKASDGIVTVENGSIYFNGRSIVNPLTERILEFVKQGLPFKPMTNFLTNLMNNPSKTSVDELYLFLENNSLPITEDGCFLAYKKVKEDYTSYHANPDGTYEDHSVGCKPEMPRNEVDDNRERTCSKGWHFCSLSYLPKYYGGRGKVMILKINPADVVSIPSDYNNAKGRAWRYEVIGENKEASREIEEAFNQPVYNSDGTDYEPDDNEYCDFCGDILDVDGYCPQNCEDTHCGNCGDHYDYCRCDDDYMDDDAVEEKVKNNSVECGKCGLHENNCVCDNGNDDTLGRKPSGGLFHNVRDRWGRFKKRNS